MNVHALIVEDEPEIAELIQFHLTREGINCRTTDSGKFAVSYATKNIPDIILLDRMLPDVDGMDVCRSLKAETSTRDIPIIMVTARGEDVDIVSGIEIGADDYLVKPFSHKVLIARVKNILRRSDKTKTATDSSHCISLLNGQLRIDSDRHQVEIKGSKIELTLTEFSLLKCLAERPGFVRTRDQLISAVHGQATILSSRTVDVHITALRKKMGELAACVETVRGVGYRFSEHLHTPASD